MTSEKWKRDNVIFPNGYRRLFEQKRSARFEYADYVNTGLAGVTRQVTECLACVRSTCIVIDPPDSAVLELRRMLQADDFVSFKDGCLPNAQVQCSSRFPIQ